MFYSTWSWFSVSEIPSTFLLLHTGQQADPVTNNYFSYYPSNLCDTSGLPSILVRAICCDFYIFQIVENNSKEE